MGLLVCFACGRQREVKPIKKGAKYLCSNCGAKQIRVIRSRNHASNISWCDRDGIGEHEAKHQTYARILGHAEARKFNNSKGYAAHKFREIFARWPNGEASESATPPDHELRRWLIKQGRDWRKQKRQQELRLVVVDAGVRLWGADDGGNSTGHSSLMTDDDWAVRW